MSSPRIIVVGAGPVGTKLALELRKEFKEVEIYEKRPTPGGRHEVLFLSDASLNTLPEDVQKNLFDSSEEKSPKAFRSNLVYTINMER